MGANVILGMFVIATALLQAGTTGLSIALVFFGRRKVLGVIGDGVLAVIIAALGVVLVRQ